MNFVPHAVHDAGSRDGEPEAFYRAAPGDREPHRGEKWKAQGNALGNFRGKAPSPERATLRAGIALSGLGNYRNPFPRALPRAVELRPFGASDRVEIFPLKITPAL